MEVELKIKLTPWCILFFIYVKLSRNPTYPWKVTLSKIWVPIVSRKKLVDNCWSIFLQKKNGLSLYCLWEIKMVLEHHETKCSYKSLLNYCSSISFLERQMKFVTGIFPSWVCSKSVLPRQNYYCSLLF